MEIVHPIIPIDLYQANNHNAKGAAGHQAGHKWNHVCSPSLRFVRGLRGFPLTSGLCTDKVDTLAAEVQLLNPECSVTMYFSYGKYNLGTAWAFGNLEQSDLRPASVWIK